MHMCTACTQIARPTLHEVLARDGPPAGCSDATSSSSLQQQRTEADSAEHLTRNSSKPDSLLQQASEDLLQCLGSRASAQVRVSCNGKQASLTQS